MHAANVNDVEGFEAWLKGRASEAPAVYVTLTHLTADAALRIAKSSAVPIIPANLLTVDAKAKPSLVDATRLLLAQAVSDRPDGLFTTLVTDERDVALGLVYSSAESVAESLKTGRGVYQSRTRGLWYKGDSSGDIQQLVNISLDCDSDCLRFVVRQLGRGKRTLIFMFLRAYQNEDSATLPLPHALASIVGCRGCSKLSKPARRLLLLDHIRHDSSTILLY